MTRAHLLASQTALFLLACATPSRAPCPCGAGTESASPPAAEQPAKEHGAHEHSEPAAKGGKARVVSHAELLRFENSGNSLVGLATPSLGVKDVEVWRSSIAVGSRTPLHTHESDEVFVVLAGEGVMHVGDQALPFSAPATVIAPAGVAHWVENTGSVPTDQIVVVPAGSSIVDQDGHVMDLPWRK